ncbi:hypothetical protein NIES4071_37850 [Calothrix sp. NIES-4071]|nr:hypothetical protein NIES4071_37850 [Calothrix sp. NIES-4071]BAZ58102.1 hypothetical protein NIES4105_37780 [Calothrix sp. NIES-4105]
MVRFSFAYIICEYINFWIKEQDFLLPLTNESENLLATLTL